MDRDMEEEDLEEEEEDEEDERILVVHNGTYQVQAGFSGEKIPLIFHDNTTDTWQDASTEGNRDRTAKINLQIALNIEDMQDIWFSIFHSQLQIDPMEQILFMTVPILIPRNVEERLKRFMFETLQVFGFATVKSPLLSLFSIGMLSGTVLDIGYKSTTIIPVYSGNLTPHAIVSTEVGGKTIDENLLQQLSTRGYQFKQTFELNIIRDIKETCCFVASKPIPQSNKVYSLPNGRTITLHEEMYKAPECLFTFNNKFSKKKYLTLLELIETCLAKLDPDGLDEMFSEIVLSGGTTLLPGFVQRFEYELTNITSEKLKKTPKVIAPTHRKYAPWVGGSILCNMHSFYNMVTIADEYWDEGF